MYRCRRPVVGASTSSCCRACKRVCRPALTSPPPHTHTHTYTSTHQVSIRVGQFLGQCGDIRSSWRWLLCGYDTNTRMIAQGPGAAAAARTSRGLDAAAHVPCKGPHCPAAARGRARAGHAARACTQHRHPHYSTPQPWTRHTSAHLANSSNTRVASARSAAVSVFARTTRRIALRKDAARLSRGDQRAARARTGASHGPPVATAPAAAAVAAAPLPPLRHQPRAASRAP